MKKGLRIFKNVFLSILFIWCVLTLVLSGYLTLNKNEYGYTEIDNKVLVVINESNDGNGYKNGNLVIVEKKKLIDFDGYDEIFIYNTENDKVSVSHSKIVEINKAGNKAIVVLENGRELTDNDIVVGEAIKVYSLGNIALFLQSKWGFISALILCFIILVCLAGSIFYGKNKDGISEDEKFVLDEDSMDTASIATIVEAKINEPAKVKSDDFSGNIVVSNSDKEEIKQVESQEQIDNSMKPIILDVNEHSDFEDDDIELI